MIEEQELIIVDEDGLLAKVYDYSSEKYRLVQIHCTRLDDGFEMICTSPHSKRPLQSRNQLRKKRKRSYNGKEKYNTIRPAAPCPPGADSP